MGNKTMLVLGLVLMVVGFGMVLEGIKEQRQDANNILKHNMNTKGFHVVVRA